MLLLEETENRDLSIDNLRRLGLTRREAQVLLLVGQGKNPVEIAEALGMSDRTVKKHLQHIYRKFGPKVWGAKPFVSHHARPGKVSHHSLERRLRI